jgi:DNA-binding transcriptional regulator WhiA
VLRLSGDFVWEHKEEILNLIRNESGRAQATNPLEGILSLDSGDGGIEITTTNEKLAQRIGKALHKAYAGRVEYRWSGDTKLARVLWHREL